jgi:aspartyl-tRNA(Asn)/glutamyl-tRNA(Gln) amidotransferase subunit A
LKLIDTPIYELSEMLRAREISSYELLRAFLAQINEVDPIIKAYITVFEGHAYHMAEEADRRLGRGEDVTPLTGIPVALKDNLCFKGYLTTCASKILKDFIPPYNATVVDRLIDAGAVFLGKTNMDEFAMGSSTENSRFFTTRNPWDFDRVPGGSSGGSAAAVAARETPIALGSDTGGSIRQPAAFCGITGLKPTYGAVSRYGLVAFASSLDQIGPMGKDVKETALLLDAIAGHDPLDSTSADFNKPGYYKAVKNVTDMKNMKIGIPKEFFAEGMDGFMRNVLFNTRSKFEELGATLVEVSIPSVKYALPAYYVIAPSEASSNLSRYDGCRYGYRAPGAKDIITMYKKTRREAFGDEVLRRIMTGTYCLSAGYYDAYYLKAQKVRTLIKQDFDKAFEKCDLLFTPAVPSTAFKIGEKTEDPLAMYLTDIFTVSINLAGLPALVMPCGSVSGMPVGLQLIGKAFDEVSILKAGAAFQAHTGFHKKYPEMLLQRLQGKSKTS